MSFLAFSGNLKSKNVTATASRIERLSSSDEYEESDVEEPPGEIFNVKEIVLHMKLIKGRVYQQENSAGPYTFNVDALEKSKFGYAFKVRWEGFEEKDDTWEPIENFNTALSKKIRKYCKRNSIELPENFQDWMIPASDEGSSGSDDTKINHSAEERKKKVHSPSPQPSCSRPQVIEKKDDAKTRTEQLKKDLFLSPTPSPMLPAKNKKFDPLFDSSGDERETMKKEEETEVKNLSAPKRIPKIVLRRTGPRVEPIDVDAFQRTYTPKGTPTVTKKRVKRDGSIDTDSSKRTVTPKGTPNQVKKKMIKRDGSIEMGSSPRTAKPKRTPNQVKKKIIKCNGSIDMDSSPRTAKPKRTPTQVKKKKVKREGSVDTEEKPRKKKLVMKKTEERKRKNSVLSSDGIDSKKEEEELVKKIDRAALKKRAAACAKEFDEEPKKKKEKKQSTIDNEKQKPAESVKPSKGLVPTRKIAVGAASETPKMSHFEVEAKKKKKKKLEKRMREKGGIVKKEDGHKKMDDHKKDGQMKEVKREIKEEMEEEVEVEVKKEPEEAVNVKKEIKMEEEEPVEIKKEIKKEEEEDTVKVKKTEPTSSRGSRKRMRREQREEKKKPASPEPKRIEKAKKRLEIIKRRMEEFAQVTREKEIRRSEKWSKEENKWRMRMYESGRWIKTEMINDMPFSFRVEQKETDATRVRTLRRCASAERLPVSFRPLSSLHSMKSLPSEADSLAQALLEMEIGEKAVRLRQLRKRFEEKQKKEKLERMIAFKESEDTLNFKEKTEEFIREMQSMWTELMPGATRVAANRERSLLTLKAFLSLNHRTMTQELERHSMLATPECLTRTVLSLDRIFSPILNLAETSDEFRSVCDEGAHRKCKMLLTVLVALPEPHRMGDDDSSLLPANTLYDVIGLSAPCQIRAMIRGGCTFDDYFDDEGKNAAHRMMEKYSMIQLTWLIECGLDVNSAILPKKSKDMESEFYDKPWKMIKESNIKSAFISQLHSQRLTARSVVWTKRVKGVDFNLRPLTLVHTLNPHTYFTRFAAVTLCDVERKDFHRDDAVLIAVHSATVRKGKGLRTAVRRTKKKKPQLRVPYFLIDLAENDKTFEKEETYKCTGASLTIHNLANRSLHETVDLERLGSNGPTTVFKVPKKHAQILVSGRHFTECFFKTASPPEHSVLLAQYFIVPFKSAQGKFTD